MALTQVPIELSSTPGIVDNSNATAITIDSSENVGIGLTNPSSYYAENLVVAATDEGGITIECGSTEKAYFMFARGTSGSDAYRSYVGYDHGVDSMNIVSSGYINFYTDDPSTEKVRILSTGGITFNGDTAQANALDDYEEGTWTPSVAFGSISGTSITYTGKYVKVGDMVTYTFKANNATGDIQVSSYVTFGGLPFALSNNATSTVVTEDIDVFSRQGFASAGGTSLSLSACGSSSGTSDLFVSITGKISA